MVSIIFRFCYQRVIVANNHTSKAFKVERPISNSIAFLSTCLHILNVLNMQYPVPGKCENIALSGVRCPYIHKVRNAGAVLMLYNAHYESKSYTKYDFNNDNNNNLVMFVILILFSLQSHSKWMSSILKSYFPRLINWILPVLLKIANNSHCIIITTH